MYHYVRDDRETSKSLLNEEGKTEAVICILINNRICTVVCKFENETYNRVQDHMCSQEGR